MKPTSNSSLLWGVFEEHIFHERVKGYRRYKGRRKNIQKNKGVFTAASSYTIWSLKKKYCSQLKSLGINETKINLFSFMHRELLFFSPLLYFHVGVTPNNSFVLLLFVPDLGRRDSDPSAGLMIDSSFPIQREKQWIEFLCLNLDFKLHKLNIYTHISMHIHIYVCFHVYGYVLSFELH